MIIIIDAYNLLKSVLGQKQISQQQRDAFLAQARVYARRTKHVLVVVFDGGPSEWVHTQQLQGVSIVYSGVHASADEYIDGYIAQHQHKELLLVSSDHELALCADEHGVPSIDVVSFYELLQARVRAVSRADAHEGAVVKSGESDQGADLDQLMQQASIQVPVKQSDIVVAPRVRSAKKSKVERKLLQILKKL